MSKMIAKAGKFMIGACISKAKSDRDRKILEMVYDGASATTIAGELNLSISRVYDIVNKSIRTTAHMITLNPNREDAYNTSVMKPDLSTRAVNVLIENGFPRISDLAHLNTNDILSWRNAGTGVQEEIESTLERERIFTISN